MYRFILYSILLILFVRAMTRLWNGFIVGVNGGSSARGSAHVPQRGVQMVRDPICGTFIVPGGISLTRGGAVVHFCSTACRDEYAAGRRDSARAAAQGRPA